MALTLSGDDGVAGVNGSATTPAVQGTDTNTGLTFGTDTVNVVTGGSTRATVDSSGQVGIGTTSPAVTVHAEDAQAELQLKSTSGTNSAGLRFVPGGETNALYIYADGSRNINFDDHATARLQIQSDGDLSISDGNLVVASGHGIDFSGTGDGSGTMASELLADYEEGTWTPVFKGAGTAGSYTLNVHSANYTKIGRTVHLQCHFTISSIGSSGSAYAVIEGMPYDVGSDDIGTCGVQGVDITDTANHYCTLRVSGATDHRLLITVFRDNGGAVDLQVSEFGANDVVRVSMTYIAA